MPVEHKRSSPVLTVRARRERALAAGGARDGGRAAGEPGRNLRGRGAAPPRASSSSRTGTAHRSGTSSSGRSSRAPRRRRSRSTSPSRRRRRRSVRSSPPSSSRRGAAVASCSTRVVVDEGDPRLREPDEAGRPVLRRPRARRSKRSGAGRHGGRRPRLAPRRPLAPSRSGSSSSTPSARCSQRGVAVVAVGGGGVPVVARQWRPRRHRRGDRQGPRRRRCSPIGLGAERLVILTQVPAVYAASAGRPGAPLAEPEPEQDDDILAELPAGSMRPKVEAAFLRGATRGPSASQASAARR